MQTEISPFSATRLKDARARLALQRANIMHLVDLKRGGYSPRRTEMRIKKMSHAHDGGGAESAKSFLQVVQRVERGVLVEDALNRIFEGFATIIPYAGLAALSSPREERDCTRFGHDPTSGPCRLRRAIPSRCAAAVFRRYSGPASLVS
jgi:hypothetical protein